MAPTRRSIKTTFSSNNNFGASKSKVNVNVNANANNVKASALSAPALARTTVDKGVATTTTVATIKIDVVPSSNTVSVASKGSKACAPFFGKSAAPNTAPAPAPMSSPNVGATIGTGAVSKAVAKAQAQASTNKPASPAFVSVGVQVQAPEVIAAVVDNADVSHLDTGKAKGISATSIGKVDDANAKAKSKPKPKAHTVPTLPPPTPAPESEHVTPHPSAPVNANEHEHESKHEQDPDPLLLPLPAVHLPLLPSELELRDVRAYEHARQRLKRAGEREASVARRAARKVLTSASSHAATVARSSDPVVSEPAPSTTATTIAPVSVSMSVFSKLSFGFGGRSSKERKKSKERKESAHAHAHTKSRSQGHAQGESKILRKLTKPNLDIFGDQEDLSVDSVSDSDDSHDLTGRTPRKDVLLSDLVVFSPTSSSSRQRRKGMRMEDEFEMVPSVRAVIVLDDEFALGDEDGDMDEWECVSSKDGGERDAPLSYAQVVLGAV